MIIKSTLLAVIVFIGSLSIAEAQSYVNGGLAGPQTVLGWNFGSVNWCQTTFDGSTTWFYFFFPLENGYVYTNNPSFVSTLSPACQTGNRVAVYVYNLDPLLWHQVVTYSFQ